MIETGGSGRLWLLSGPGSSYALHLTERDELLHLHWGRRIALGDAEALAAEPPSAQRPFGPAPDPRAEFPVAGAAGPLPAALAVRSRPAGGAEWCFEEYEVAGPAGGGNGQELRLHFHDSRHHLDLTLHYRMRRGSDVVERWTTTARVGGPGGPLELLRADAACWTLPHRDDWRMSRLHGRWGAESQLTRAPLPPGDQLLTGGPGAGSAGRRHLPWFALDAGDAGEEHGEVWTAALAWSGPWRIAVSRLPDGQVRAAGGTGDTAPVELAPGASYASPVFAALWTDGGFGAASRAWHAHQLDHVVPGAWRLRPVACYGGALGAEGAGAADAAEAPDTDDAEEGTDAEAAYDPYPGPYGVPRRGAAPGHVELARRAAGMGVELYVVDDGPPGARLGDRAAPGDAGPGAGHPPDGLKPLSDEVHALGMRFGVRIAPETVSPDADLVRTRPEWVVPPADGGAGPEGRLLLDLARADVRDHLAGAIGALLHSAPVDHLVWDLDRHPAGTDGGERSPASGASWGARTAGLYALIDRVRAEHPGLTVESCASGTRVDLGILARTDRLGASDNTDPLDRLAVQHGFGQLHPARVMATLVTGGPAAGLNHRRSSLRFRFVSAMAGALGIGADLLELGPEERAEAASWIALHQQVRPVVQFGELYRLRPPGGGGLTAVQYVRGPETAVLAWLPAQGFGAPVPPLRLRGLDRGARYRDVTTGVVQRGAVLAERGLRTTLSGDLDAAVFHLRRV